MDDPAANQTPGENFNKIDLSALEAFQFGTQWTSAGDKKSGGERGPDDRSRAPGGDGPSRRDRRPPRRASDQESARAGEPGTQDTSTAPRDRFAPRPPGGGFPSPRDGGAGGFPRGPGGYDRERSGGGGRFDRGDRSGGGDPRFDRGGPRRPSGPPRPYESPVFEVTFYPDDHGFTALVKAMRTSCRTYELFEIARLILGKPERCVVVLRRRAADGASPDAPRAPIAIAVPTGLPFDTEDDAINYTLEKNLDQFFTTENVEIEPPKGTFQFVNRCPFTKDLLGPPNYHRYAQTVQQHYLTRGIRVPFENYKASIEVVRDPEAVNRWLESMKKVTRYTFKGEVPAGEPGAFDNLEDARAFLLRTNRDRIARMADGARVAAKVVEVATTTEAFRAMSGAVDVQRRFPLDTANALRGRLRRENFNIFKRGAKGVTYVCSVRRKFRQPGQTFSDSINQLIEFLDQNPMVLVNDLATKLLGFSPPAPPPAAVTAPASDAPPADHPPADAIPGEPSAEPSPAPASVGLTLDQINALNRLMLDLRWLVTEGYVAEYSDGRLVAHPVMTPQAQAQEEKGGQAPEVASEAAAEPAAESAPAPEAPSTETLPEAVSEPSAEANAVESPVETPAEEPPPAPASPEEPPPTPAG